MQPSKPQEPRIYSIEEPGKVAPGLVPEMCVGCPECKEPAEGRLPLVYSLEDPVEYHIASVTQVPILGAPDFARLLRAFMRADPDVIIVGGVHRPMPSPKAAGDEGSEQ